MLKLRTEAVARLLNQPQETVRHLVRTGAVDWGAYIKPKTARYGHGHYIYYEHKFAAAVGLPVEKVMEART